MNNTIRAKVFFLGQRWLLSMLNSHRFKDGSDNSVVTICEPSGIPDSAFVSQVHYSSIRQGLEVLVVDDSFEEVRLDGAELPSGDSMSIQMMHLPVVRGTVHIGQDLRSISSDELKLMRQAINEELYDRERA